jgi:AraC-like DNA-binding protein
MDPLSQVIGLLKPRELTWRVMQSHAPWAIRFPQVEAVVFGQLIEGRCQVDRGDGPILDFEPGDFLLMAYPPQWTMRSEAGVEPVDLKAVLAEAARAPETRAGDVIRFLAGHFLFSAPSADLLAALLPPLVHIRAADVAAGRLGLVLQLLGDEASADLPGRSLLLDRLLEVVLVEALRRQPEGLDAARPGLLAGLADPRISRALQALHADAARAWTVAELAREAGMSRASFAARFAQVVGASPIGYLAAWRMSLAKAALVSAKAPLIEIAEMTGYASVSAFSTAFSRATGVSPSAYSRLGMAL